MLGAGSDGGSDPRWGSDPSLLVLSGGRLRPPAPAGDDLAGHLARARVAEIGLLRTAARVGEVDAHHRTLRLLHFLAAVVAHEPRNTCHGFPPRIRRCLVR